MDLSVQICTDHSAGSVFVKQGDRRKRRMERVLDHGNHHRAVFGNRFHVCIKKEFKEKNGLISQAVFWHAILNTTSPSTHVS